MLDRLQVAYKKDNTVFVTHSSKIPQLLQNGSITENTIVFNTTVANDKEFETSFEIPLKESWLNRFLVVVK